MYEAADRLIWLMDQDQISLKSYLKKWERGRKCFYRDIEHLRVFYDIEFRYDRSVNLYLRTDKKNQAKQDDWI